MYFTILNPIYLHKKYVDLAYGDLKKSRRLIHVNMSHVLGAVYSELRTDCKHKIHENVAKHSNLPLIHSQWYFSRFIGKKPQEISV